MKTDVQRSLSVLLSSVETDEALDALDAVSSAIEAMQGQTWTVGTLRDVADFFGVEEQTVRQWRMRNPPIPGDQGRWNLKEIVQWRLNWSNKQTRPPTEEEALLASAGPDAEHWKTEWTRSKAQLADLELAVKTGRLVALDELVPVLRRTASTLAESVRRLEAEYGREAAAVIRTSLERLTEEAERLGQSD